MDLYWTSTGPLLSLYWRATGPFMDLYWTPHWTFAGPLMGLYCTATAPLLDIYWTSTGLLLDLRRKGNARRCRQGPKVAVPSDSKAQPRPQPLSPGRMAPVHRGDAVAPSDSKGKLRARPLRGTAKGGCKKL